MKHRRFSLVVLSILLPVSLLVSLFVFLRFERAQATSTIRFVALGGACGSAAPCYATIQAAVDDSRSGDEIRIARGVYTDMNHYAGLAQLVYISRTVTLRGGYSVDDWEHPDPDAHTTILDAQESGRGIYISGFISPILENLSIQNGDATGLGGASWPGEETAGGGMVVVSATVTVSGTVWDGNHADWGGGVYAQDGHFRVSHSTFLSNTAIVGGGLFFIDSDSRLSENLMEYNRADGGGLAVYNGHTEILANRIIRNGHSGSIGGGVLLEHSSGSLIGNLISENRGATGAGAGLVGDILILGNTISKNSGGFGGGLFLFDGNISLIDNIITGNRSESVGGGVAVDHSSNLLDPTSKILSGNIISGNTAAWNGGGVFLQFVRPISTHNQILNNTAEERGGGIFVNSSEANLDGDRIQGNRAKLEGGGIAIFAENTHVSNTIIAENQAGTQGSALYLFCGSLDLSHATVANNPGSSGISVQTNSDCGVLRSTLSITNTILVSHTLGITASMNSTVTVDGVLWFRNTMNTFGEGHFTITHALEGDPRFISGDYHILENSAARDAGILSTIHHDIDGEPRPFGLFDLGADEFWPAGMLKQLFFPLFIR